MKKHTYLFFFLMCRMIFLFPSPRWAFLRLVTEMLSLSPILGAAWLSAASHLVSSSMECPSPFFSTSSLTTTPNWRNRSTHFQTLSAHSSFGSVWGASLKTVSNPHQKNLMMRFTFDPVEDILTMTTLKNESLTINSLIKSLGSYLCPTLSWYEMSHAI